jgi:hypothetical protein
MILEDYERYVIEYEFELARIPKDAPSMPLRSCLPYLTKLVDDGKACHKFSNDKAAARVIAYKVSDDDKYVTILLQLADEKASDPAFAQIETGKSRTVHKADGEGLAVTAHLMIKLDPINDTFPDTYSALLEEVPGITRTIVGAMLSAMFHEAVDFDFIRETEGKKSRCKCRPRAFLHPLAGQSLSECFKTGWLVGFSAVQHSKENLLDEEGEVTITESRLTLSTKKSRAEKAIELVTRTLNLVTKRGYTGLRILYEDENKRRKGIPVDNKRKDIMAQALVKTELVRLADKIEQCQQDIHDDLNGKMLKIMLRR